MTTATRITQEEASRLVRARVDALLADRGLTWDEFFDGVLAGIETGGHAGVQAAHDIEALLQDDPMSVLSGWWSDRFPGRDLAGEIDTLRRDDD